MPVDRLEEVFRAALLPEQTAKKDEPHAPIPAAQGQPKRGSIAQ